MKRIILFFLVTISVTWAIPNAWAGDTLTMQEAIDVALGRNPGLEAARQKTTASFARPSQAATPPDPQFMVQFSQVPIDTIDVNQGMITYMVQQKIPFPSKLVYGYKAEKRAAEADSSMENVTSQELVRQVKITFLDVWKIQEEERIERRTLVAYRTSKGAAETAYASLGGTIADPVRASVDLGDVEAKLLLLEQDKIEVIARLSALMDKPLDPDLKVKAPDNMPRVSSVNTLLEKAKTSRPELTQTSRMTESRHARLSLAKSQYGPDLTLRWGYDDRPNQQNAWTGRVMLSVPLWSLSKQRFGVRESKAMLKRAESLEREMLLATEADVKSIYARYNAARKRRKIYSSRVVPRARQLYSSSREAYRSGKGDFLSVVDSIRSLNNAELMLIRSKVDTYKAIADLERAVGGKLLQEGV